MSAYSRRDFLKVTLATGGGLAAGVGFPRLLGAQGREPIKVGVLHSQIGRAHV